MCCIGNEEVVTVILEEGSELQSIGSKVQSESRCLAAGS